MPSLRAVQDLVPTVRPNTVTGLQFLNAGPDRPSTIEVMADRSTKVMTGPTQAAEIARLEAERQLLYEEIKSYPTPIAGCDQQFNYLLERQARVIAELRSLHDPQTSEVGL
jgi:hypothetical protein